MVYRRVIVWVMCLGILDIGRGLGLGKPLGLGLGSHSTSHTNQVKSSHHMPDVGASHNCILYMYSSAALPSLAPLSLRIHALSTATSRLSVSVFLRLVLIVSRDNSEPRAAIRYIITNNYIYILV